MAVANQLLDLDRSGLVALCEQQLGEKPFRAVQLMRWIHQRGARSFDRMTDLAKSLRDKLQHKAPDDWLTTPQPRIC